MEQVGRWWNGHIFPANARRDIWLYADDGRWRVEWKTGYDEPQHRDYDDEEIARARCEALMALTEDDWRELVPPNDEAAPSPKAEGR